MQFSVHSYCFPVGWFFIWLNGLTFHVDLWRETNVSGGGRKRKKKNEREKRRSESVHNGRIIALWTDSCWCTVGTCDRLTQRLDCFVPTAVRPTRKKSDFFFFFFFFYFLLLLLLLLLLLFVPLKDDALCPLSVLAVLCLRNAFVWAACVTCFVAGLTFVAANSSNECQLVAW